MDRIEVRFYGRLAERFGRRVELAAPPAGLRVAEIRDLLGSDAQLTALLEPRRARAVVGDVLVAEDFRVEAGGAVELLPPLSGG